MGFPITCPMHLGRLWHFPEEIREHVGFGEIDLWRCRSRLLKVTIFSRSSLRISNKYRTLANNDKALESVEKYLMEDRLLTEFEKMGFKKVDLNKEVLRMNDYDLEKSVDDLCGVADSDPIPEVLQGF